MRVGILVPDVYMGGVTRAFALAQMAVSLGHETWIRGPVVGGRSLYPEPPPGVAVFSEPGLARYYRSLSRACGVDPPDVLIARKPWLASYGAALLTRRATRIPVLLDFDDWEPIGMGVSGRVSPSLGDRARALLRSAARVRDPGHPAYNRLMQRLVPRADAITASTRTIAERFGGRWVPQARDTKLFDPSRYDAEACRRALGLAGKRVLLFPGTVRAHKGLEDVLAALDDLDQPDLRLVVAGGRQTDFSREFMARGSRWLVELPQRGDQEMPMVVAAAHAVVVPQRDLPPARSQFPIKLTDAMAMAKPIVTTRVGDVPEIVDDTAWVVEPGAPGALAGAIGEVFADLEAACRRGRHARRRCIERFSIDAAARELEPVLARLARGAPHG